jgi:hypothetical protein
MRNLIAIGLLLGASGSATAVDTIVNVPGTYSLGNCCAWSPLAVQFDAGAYTVTPVVRNSVPGAQFTAYNFGMGLGWSSAYSIALDPANITDYGSAGPYAGSGYPDEATAFLHTAAGSFSLPQAGTVYFGVPDSIHGDNFGGVSLRVAPVPEPAGIMLLMAGLGMLFLRAKAKGWLSRLTVSPNAA